MSPRPPTAPLIGRRMAELDLSPLALAALCEVGVCTVRGWIRGQRPQARMLARIARELDLPLEALQVARRESYRCPTPPKENRMDTTLHEATCNLLAEGPATTREIAEETGIPMEIAAVVLSELEALGLIWLDSRDPSAPEWVLG